MTNPVGKLHKCWFIDKVGCCQIWPVSNFKTQTTNKQTLQILGRIHCISRAGEQIMHRLVKIDPWCNVESMDRFIKLSK